MGTRTVTDDTITLGNKVVEKTAIIQLEATVDELINATGETIKKAEEPTGNGFRNGNQLIPSPTNLYMQPGNYTKEQLYEEPAAYFLVHCGGRKLAIGDRLDEVHKQITNITKNVPFITIFTFGEYGYDEHSANICGGLMLSFTAFGKK